MTSNKMHFRRNRALRLFVLALLFMRASLFTLAGPYAPGVGFPGTQAVSRTHPSLVAWATGWQNYVPGVEVAAQWQTPHRALGPATGQFDHVVSLGRGGRITLTFNRPIANGPGYDFAVFENAFNNTFLELAFVEVSSDGTSFVRFPNDSLTRFTSGVIDPTNVTGLASKYGLGYGTPFDLSSLPSHPQLDLAAVTHIRLIDIVSGMSRDSSGNLIFDPYPTFTSAGFDLEAVGVFHEAPPPEPPPAPVLDVTIADGQCVLSWQAHPRTTYYLEMSLTMESNSWTRVHTAENTARETQELSWSTQMGAGSRFFRLVLP